MWTHLAYLGVGIVALLGVAVGPALIPYLLEAACWWFSGKKTEAPRLTRDYGQYWTGGGIILVGLAAAYGVGYAVFRFIIK